jgi:hypothetical protein
MRRYGKNSASVFIRIHSPTIRNALAGDPIRSNEGIKGSVYFVLVLMEID